MVYNLNIIRPLLNLSKTEGLIIDNTKKFCREVLHLHLKSKNNHKQIYKDFGKMGLLGPTLSNVNYGLSYKMYGLIAKEIEYIDSGYRSMYSVQSSLVMNPINKYGTNAVKEKYLEKLSTGEYIGCFGLTEPHSGSDASSMKTFVKKDGDDYILNGSKTWITNSPIADVFVVWAKNNNIINGFVLDRGMKGITTPEIKDKMSLLSSKTGMIFLDDVRVPKENKLSIKGMKGPFECLNSARLGISFGVLGAAECCLETTIDYAMNRTLFSGKLSEKQIFQYKLADMVTEYNLGFSAVYEVVNNYDKNKCSIEMISLVKRNNCQKSLEIVRKCRDMLGGNGISSEYPIFRHLINLETVNTYEGTHDIHSLIIGNSLCNYKSF